MKGGGSGGRSLRGRKRSIAACTTLMKTAEAAARKESRRLRLGFLHNGARYGF